MARLRITWKRSAIGYAKQQRQTIRALGLRSLNQSIVKDDSPAIRGMIGRVRHLVQVEEVAEE
jgi:large subunit ribosomal protein L30